MSDRLFFKPDRLSSADLADKAPIQSKRIWLVVAWISSTIVAMVGWWAGCVLADRVRRFLKRSLKPTRDLDTRTDQHSPQCDIHLQGD
jgi:hypothetical protein